MGIAIPQVITPDRATGAQVIDGSLRFDSSKSNRLEKTPFTEGSRTTYTYSVWIKRHTFGEMVVLGAYQDDSNRTRLLFDANDRMQFFTRLSNNSHSLFTDARLRDPSNFYHLVWSVDTTQSTASERVKMYINGVLQTLTGTDYPDQNELTFINKSEEHNIGNGQDSGGDEAFFNGSMSQAYFIDGQQLGPENFGFTDPLTNTWKPKKYTGDFNNLPDINLAGTGSGESIEVVINRQVDKAWIKSNGSSTYEGGGDPSDPSSAPSFHLPSGGSLYWFTTAYDSAHTMVIGSSSETGTQPEWASGGTTGSLTRDSATQVSGTPSSSYASARTDALADDTVYAFTFTITTGTSGNHTGWFLSTSSSYSSGTPDEQSSGNTAGARFYGYSDAYYPYVAVYGSFATANPNVLNNSITKLSLRGRNSFYLPFDGNSSIGEDRSGIVTPNDGTIWSTLSSDPDTVKNSGDADELFNGNLSTGGVVLNRTTTASDEWYVALDGVSIPCTNNVAFYSGNGSSTATMRINGNNLYKKEAGSTSVEWQYLSFTGTITKIELAYLDGSGSSNTFYGIKVDGHILIDDLKGSSSKPSKFGGSNSPEKATGAKPILNTPGGSAAGVGVFGSRENKTVTVTVASKTGGGNAYFFDSVERDSLATIRGSTITFDTTDSSNNSHPFKLSSTDADSSSGTEYTDGVAYYINGSVTTGSDYVTNYSTGAASGFRGIKWTVPHNVSTTYYYCTVHNGMGEGGRLTSTTDETKTDLFAWKNVLALPLVGVATDVSNQINSGSTRKEIAVYYDAAPSDGQGMFYNTSFYFDGSADYIQTSFSDDFVVGTGDFTIEGWYNVAATQQSNARLFAQKTNDQYNWDCYIDSTSGTNTIMMNGGNTNLGMSFPSANVWHHFCIVRKDSTLYSFMNGVLRNTQEYTNSIGVNNYGFRVGNIGSATGYGLNGYVQDFRFYKGIAKYTSDFIPASTNPDILPDTPSGVSGSSKLTKITDGAVSFDGTGDYLQFDGSAGSNPIDFGTGDFTVEAFVYHTGDADDTIISDSSGWTFTYGAGGDLRFYMASGSNVVDADTTFLSNQWVHVAVVRQSGTLTFFQNGIAVGSSSYSHDISANGSSTTIGKYHGGTSQNWKGFISNLRVVQGTALYTSDFTPPTRTLTNVTNTKLLCCQSVSEQQNNFIRMFLSDTLYTSKADILANATEVQDGESGITDKYWYIVPTGTEPDDGTSAVFTNDGSVTTPHANNHFALLHRSGSSWVKTSGTYNSAEYSDFRYKTEDSIASGVNYSVVPSRDFYVFGVDDGSPAPELIGGTLPTRAKYHKFEGAVKPGTIRANGDAAAITFNPFNTDINTVRGQETGYCTFNPLSRIYSGTATFSNGNLEVSESSSAARPYVGTIAMTSGKHYWEITKTAGATTDCGVGIIPSTITTQVNIYDSSLYTYRGTGTKYVSGTETSYGSAWAVDDVIGVALNLDDGEITFYKNGVPQGDITGVSITTSWLSFCGDDVSATNTSWVGNWGQKPFKFPPPDGFQPLNGANARPETVISRPDQYVGITTWRGNATSGRLITGLNFNAKPDLIWIKNRGEAVDHALFDSVRGFGANKELTPNDTYTEGATGVGNPNSDAWGYVNSNNFNGFTVNNGSSGQSLVNNNNIDYVAWCWKAGTSYTPTVTGGFSAPSASINTDAGFGIYKVTGSNSQSSFTTGLNEQADFIICKNLDNTYNWGVYHRSDAGDAPSAGLLHLDNSSIPSDKASTIWYQTGTTIEVNSYAETGSNGDYIYYVWHDVPGLQKFGEYVGNGSNDGPFVHLGFRPALVWIKRYSVSTGNWRIFDNLRNEADRGIGNNPIDAGMNIEAVVEAYTSPDLDIDFLSDGFKIRNNSTDNNISGSGYIYCAWAEAPSIDLYGGGANAR